MTKIEVFKSEFVVNNIEDANHTVEFKQVEFEKYFGFILRFQAVFRSGKKIILRTKLLKIVKLQKF